MQYIKTKYLCPTDHKGSRIKATASGGQTLTIHYDHALNSDDLHAKAALELAARLGWSGEYAAGSGDDGHVFVPVTEANTYSLEAA
jgi:hypothetical protein